ncbi:hypothetical protein N9B94_03475 [Verrucomicrobia bacterium]|nr:hypothetical protein [Verrucomicrobiota bacterium]MDB4459032.1 hypothetical protein [bacterium]
MTFIRDQKMSLVIAAFVGASLLSPALSAKEVTFSEHIAPLIFNNCYECHRSGEATPFTLKRFLDVRKRAKTIQKMLQKRFMPPWHPAPGDVEFHASRRLNDEQIALFEKWVATEKAEGEADKLPKLPSYAGGWTLGEPDMTVSMASSFAVPAEGNDIYRNFTIPLYLPEDKWLTEIEIRPDERSVVHHVLYFTDQSGVARKLDGSDGKPGFKGMGFRATQVGGWAVGGVAAKLPQGLAREIPQASDMVLGCHFHPVGKATKVKITAALYFTDKKPSRDLVRIQAPAGYGRGTKLSQGIQPGDKNFQINGSYTLPAGAELVQLSGHAHYICTSMKATATLPGGKVLNLLSLPAWEFNWQGRYELKEGLRLPKGTVLHGEVNYHNSADNPHNPNDPPKRIKWGTQTSDEMGSLFFGMAVDDGALFNKKRKSRPTPSTSKSLGARLKALDRNEDGKLETSELPARFQSKVSQIDTNKDGALDSNEIIQRLLKGR